MAQYDDSIYRGLLIQGKLRDAVSYLSRFPEKERLVSKYESVFEGGKTPKKSGNGMIDRILTAYQAYYREVFWQRQPKEDAASRLCSRLAGMFGLSAALALQNAGEALGEAEHAAEAAAEAEGYYFLGGMTQGYFGPYIWKSTEPVAYDVALPNGTFQLTVHMMDGFVSRSWLDFLSFGKIGAGGWTSQDGALYCVRSAYAREICKPAFKVSYLMHEAQHAQNTAAFPGISPTHMEYRAKLAELIGYPRLSLLKSFLCEASGEDEGNTHAYASFLVVRNLSRRVFGCGYEGDFARWRGKLTKVRHAARALLDEYPQGV